MSALASYRPQQAPLRVVEMGPQDELRWESFVDSHPDGLIYHRRAWLQVLEREYGRRSSVLACEDASGQLMGILPLLETRGLPINLGRQATGRRVASLPRTPLAGPLAMDGNAAVVLLKAAVDRVRETPGVQLQIKTDRESFEGAGLGSERWRLTYVLDLPAAPEQVRFGNSRNHARIKWANNKAAKLGVVVREAETEPQLRDWYRLYLDTMRWHCGPPRPYRFFQACWDLLRPQGLMRLLLAEQVENDRSRLLAGSMFLMSGKTVFYAFNGRRKEYLSLRPNDAIHWQAIHDACRAGFRHYDFGEVVEENQGLAEFKGKWGTEARPLYRHYHPASHQAAAAPGPPGRAHQWATATWRRLPLRATVLLGDRIYAYL